MTLAKQQKWTLGEPKAMDAKAKVMKQAKEATRAKLQALEGPMFDHSYMAAMVEDHDHTITKVAKAAQQFKGTPLGDQLTQLLPRLQQHREHAYRVLGEVKADGKATGVGGAGEVGSGMKGHTGHDMQGGAKPKSGTGN
jgi:predicted outer membrane protein